MRCFLFLLPNHTNFVVFFVPFALFSDEPEVFFPKYSQTAILHAAHFRRVVNKQKRNSKDVKDDKNQDQEVDLLILTRGAISQFSSGSACLVSTVECIISRTPF